MKTIILCRGKLEPVTDHKQPVPITESGRVDYDAMRERIEQVYLDRIENKIKRNLCEVIP